MYRQHFGLKYPPLGKDIPELWDDGALAWIPMPPPVPNSGASIG
jgi:hypothetical protein